MSELWDMMEWEKLNKMKPEVEVTTNAKEGEYVVVEMEKDPFYDCRWGQINAIPEHNVYQSYCKLKNMVGPLQSRKISFWAFGKEG